MIRIVIRTLSQAEISEVSVSGHLRGYPIMWAEAALSADADAGLAMLNIWPSSTSRSHWLKVVANATVKDTGMGSIEGPAVSRRRCSCQPGPATASHVQAPGSLLFSGASAWVEARFQGYRKIAGS